MNDKIYKDLKTKVEQILSNYEAARNSDITLMLLLWEQFFPEYIEISRSGRKMVDIKALYDLPREDNIKRVRAEIQNVERRYLPTDIMIFIKRARLSDEWKQVLGYRTDWKSPEWERAIRTYLKPTQTSLL